MDRSCNIPVIPRTAQDVAAGGPGSEAGSSGTTGVPFEMCPRGEGRGACSENKYPNDPRESFRRFFVIYLPALLTVAPVSDRQCESACACQLLQYNTIRLSFAGDTAVVFGGYGGF